MDRLTLFGEPGWGSTLAEAQLAWYGIPFEFQRVATCSRKEAAAGSWRRSTRWDRFPRSCCRTAAS